MWRTIGTAFSELLDLVAPRLCLVCDKRLTRSEETVCSACIASLPLTPHLLHPRESALARLYWGIVPVEKAAALMVYETGSDAAHIVHQLKYGGNPDVAYQVGRLMGQLVKPSGFFDEIDTLIPVPLAPKRHRQRGYNQSEQLARGLAEVTGLRVDSQCLRRTSFSKSQTGLHRWDRRDNVENAFQATEAARRLAQQHVLLIDDVVTTGSTTQECLRALLQEVPTLRCSVMALASPVRNSS